MKLSLPVIALRNLMRRPMRTLFTAAGVAIGIGAIIAIGGMSSGMETTWARGMEARGTDLVISGKGGGMGPAMIDEALKKQILGLEGVTDATSILLQFLSIEDASMVAVSGREWGGYGWSNLKIIKGRMPLDGSEKAVVLGVTAAEILKKKIGDTLQVELEEFKVVGIAEGGSVSENGSVAISLPLLQQATNSQGKINFVNIRLKAPVVESAARELCRQIEAKFPSARASLASEALNSNRGYRMVRAGSWSTSVLAILVGIFGVMNTMLMSVFERTHEIGVLSALGWRRKRIVFTIVLESLLLSLVGYALGLAMGLMVLAGLARSPVLKGLVEPHVGVELLGIALVSAVFVGVASSIYPALKGARTSPGVALRAA